MNIKPLGGRVLIKLLKKEDVTKSGIVLPDTMDKEKKAEGEVIAVGPGKMMESGSLVPMPVKVGEKVLVKSWGGDEVKIDGVEYKIFDSEDILAIVEN
jgi:chaperonin GroES